MSSPGRQVWRTSSHSGTNGGQCVQVAFDRQFVLIRDSKYLRNPANDPARQPLISVRVGRWPDFLDLALGCTPVADTGLPFIDRRDDGSVSLTKDGVVLTYTAGEWVAFTAGVRDGEFAAVA